MKKPKKLPHGMVKKMSPEQQKERKRLLQKIWRQTHPEYVKAENHKWALYYVKNKPFICTCKICGEQFNACRNYYVRCPNCIQKRREAWREHVLELKENAKEKAENKKQRNKTILELNKQGFLQKEIAQKLNMRQRTVSAILLKNGVRTQKYLTRKKKNTNL